MSIVPKETVEVIAQSIGINSLTPDAALALAPDVEYRMREIMQEGIKCMHHSKRTTLTTDDIDSALSMRNVEPLYGFASGDPLRFKRALGHKDLFYLDDKEVDLKEVIEAPLPKAPLDTSLFCHWLAIEGVQPAIPENAPIEVIASLPETKKPEQKSDELPVDIRLPVKHVLSRELQLYFNKITELAVSMPDSVLFKEALSSLATDSGLHPLVPYFTCFIEDEVSRGLNDFQLLFALMRLVWGLLQNPHIHLEPYLHQLMPPVVTCILAKRLGKRIADNHWELRDFAANLVAHICKRFGHNYTSLQTRLTTTLLKPFLDPKRSLTQHYGAVQGLAALGPHVVRLRILPNLEINLGILEEILRDNEKKEMTRHEAWRVYGALLRAAGRSIYDVLKLFPVLPSPPANSVWKANSRVIGTNETHKRKANPEELEQQPSPKKLITDGPVVSPSSNNDMAIDTQGETVADADETAAHAGENTADAGETAPDAGETAPDAGETAANSDIATDVQGETAANSGETAANAGKPEPEISSARKRMSNNGGVKDTNGKREKGSSSSSSNALRTPAYLKQVWKDDLNSGQLVISLFELFGEEFTVDITQIVLKVDEKKFVQQVQLNLLLMGLTQDDFDRESELKAFDETKGGVKGLVDSGITKVPQIFIQPPDDFPQANIKFNLPIIDLQGFNSDPVRRNEIVKEIREASRTWGFFQVINHEIPVSVLREMRDGALRFFNMDHEVKKEWYVTDSTKKIFYNSNVDLSSTLPVRWRDSFHCRMAPDPPNPQELPPLCRDILIEYSKQITKLGCSLFELISEALGLRSSYLKDIGCADGLSTICHYYPASPQPELTIGARKHADNDFLTVLLQDHIGGLQFLHKNQWVNVPFVPGALVVNIGDLLQMMSNDEVMSAEHRVVSSCAGPRVSVACFFTTGMVETGKVFEPIKELLSEENPAKYRPTTMKAFVQHSHSKVFDKSSMSHFRI